MVPLDGSADFDTVRGFARAAADSLAERYSDQLTTAARKSDRRDRVYLDVMRNAYAQTAAMPYSVRPNAEAGVPRHSGGRSWIGSSRGNTPCIR